MQGKHKEVSKTMRKNDTIFHVCTGALQNSFRFKCFSRKTAPAY